MQTLRVSPHQPGPLRASVRKNPSPRQLRRRAALMAGVTLLELMVVVALIGILASIGTPAFRDMAGRYRLNAATREAVNLIKQARYAAVTRGARTRVVFADVDAAPTNGGSGSGLIRVEKRVVDSSGTETWELMNLSNVSSSTLPTDKCPTNLILPSKPVLREYCLDVDAQYLNVTLSGVDAIGASLRNTNGLPVLEFGPEGFALNPDSDFQAGSSRQEVGLVLTYKHASGQLDSRMILVGRTGNVRIQGYRGSSIPTP